MIYYVEDDQSIRELLLYALRQAGHTCLGFASATPFWQAMAGETPDLVLLDVMLPGEDGRSILRNMRKDRRYKNIPTILITAKGQEGDRVCALEEGADDYIVKPFGIMEALSRIRAVLRRSTQDATPSILTVGIIELDEVRHRVTVAGEPVELTLKQFTMLRFFLINKGIALTREQLLDAVWGIDYEGGERTVDVHVQTLRQKLGPSGQMINTIRQIGYRLEE